MSQSIDEAQVRHIARLARLNLCDDEVRLFAGQLGDILDYVRQLEAVDTTGVEPLAHPLPLVNVLRADEPQPCFETARALANAPQREGPFFKVPAVLDPGAGA
jgi:aspartyl-tRNA(Asn)/glutamyl-tRNA(Gln) amidotransferase subunit C